MAKPGMMVYFDMMGPVSKLPDEEKGRLFWAMLEYAKEGTIPNFEGLALSLAWEFVKPKLDADAEAYNKAVLKRQYATFCRECKKHGQPEITFDEWLDTVKHQMISNDIKWYPTTTTTTKTTTTTTTATAANATGFAAANIDIDDVVCFGKGVVKLDGQQVSCLVGQMGRDTAAYYVDKLANFIIEKDAKVQDHCETILKWWQEDGKVRRTARRSVPKGASGKLGAAELENIRRLMMED
jgi:hypothetical protein